MRLFKSKYFKIALLLVIAFYSGITVSRVMAFPDLGKKLDIFLEVIDLVRNHYVEKNLEDTKLIYGSIKGLLDALDDPYTRFVEPKSYREMKTRMVGSYGGIGIYIGMRDKQLTVISPIEGTPAWKEGLKAADKIVSIDGRSTKDMAIDEAVSLIRGPEGTAVKLGILRGKMREPKIYSIARKVIVIKSVEKRMLNREVGYIKLITFENQKAPVEIKAAIVDLKKKAARGLILDLRNNGGGLLQNAIDIASMFVNKGTIVYTIDREGRRDTAQASGRAIWTKPLVVLVNGASASASEILAGAIDDNKIGTLVGTHTFGKASVQNIHQLEDGSAVLLTVAKYYTPSGHDISKKGISPEVVAEMPTREAEEEMVELPEEERHKIEDKEDLQLQKAIEIIKTKI